MEEINLYEPNPKLKIDDRIILIRMLGDDVPALSKGVVVGFNNQPRYSPSDSGMAYWVEFFDSETGEFITKLTMIPEDDIWIYDIDYYENKDLKEGLFYLTKKNINKVRL